MSTNLALDDTLVARARQLAEQRHVALEEIVEDYLRQLCAADLAAEYRRSTEENAGRSEPGWRFDREACHDRSARD